MCFFCLQSSVLLLILSEMSCIMEVNGEDQVLAAEVQNLTPVQMGNIRVSDLMAGLVQSTVTSFTHQSFDVRCVIYLFKHNVAT